MVINPHRLEHFFFSRSMDLDVLIDWVWFSIRILSLKAKFFVIVIDCMFCDLGLNLQMNFDLLCFPLH